MVGAVPGNDVCNKWSDEKMEGKEGFSAIECLRARLLAERHASKLANDEAESLGLKLIELENKLRQEIKFKERAERRLRFLEKKLKSFNISSTSGESEQSYSSGKCESSLTTNSSASTDAEENETEPHSANSPISGIQTHNGPPVSKDFDCPQDLRENPSPNSEDFNNNESRLSFSSSKSSARDSVSQGTNIYSSRTTSPSSSSSHEEPGHHDPNLSSDNVKNDEMRDGI
ncbi:uncharacterized protein LOC129309084 isoform X2 [Prosopis cineraria]|uniref:uncharacterized protein LOC129309084 isoform X2 n=1 Tax=Prosopis cineraria TaxID=364024 RepID=UPI0024108249|nr:uncharacterized protein LOC129309084 isoform X2 [Prosopis cineraria]